MNIKDIDFNKDYYKTLGIDKNADDSEIKKTYRKLSLKYHPDRHTDDSEEDKKKAEEKFVEVNEAYSILSNKELRAAYDRGPVNPFMGFGNSMGDAPQPGQTLVVRIKVSYDDICHGIKDKTIKYKRMVRCDVCHGEGGEGVETCSYCHGTGMITETKNIMGSIFHRQYTCPHCYGKGKHVSKTCSSCGGSGLKQVDTTYKLNLDTEYLVQNGVEIFVGYYGNESTDKNGRDGELIFKIIHDIPDNMEIVRTQNGWSVVEAQEIPYYDMLLGTKKEIYTPSGKKIAITVPECCTDGQQLRAKGQGFNISGQGQGDYILIVTTKHKDCLTNEEKKLLNKIKKENESKS